MIAQETAKVDLNVTRLISFYLNKPNLTHFHFYTISNWHYNWLFFLKVRKYYCLRLEA